MRLGARSGQNKLDWSILDVEQDEWEQRMADLGIAAAANGFPFGSTATPPVVNREDGALRWPAAHPAWRARHVLAAVVAFGVLAALVGFGVWRTAQAGIVRMQGDVANAVKLERLHEQKLGRVPASQASLQASVHGVEFLDNAAMATVLVTRTQRAGGVVVQPELRFYVQTPQGWQHSEPVAAFWGPTATLDTAHLHFVFGSRDRAVVADVAPSAEALYVTLRRAMGQDLAGDGRVWIEIVPGYFPYYAQRGDGRIRLTSPSLYLVAEQQRGDLLGHLLRLSLSDQQMGRAAQRAALKPQWQPMVGALDSWLKFSNAIPFAPGDEAVALRRLQSKLLGNSWQLADLQEEVLRYDPASRSMVVFTLISDAEGLRQRRLAAEQLIDYIATEYGIDVLPKLLEGFSQYEDWEALAPAVLGVSAAELERGWHAGE